MQRLIIAFALITTLPPVTFAQTLTLVAGGGTGGDGVKATDAKLITPFGCDFDSAGRLYFVEMEKGERLRRIEADGTIITLAGSGKKGNSGDGGPPLEASFNGMHGLAIGHTDTVYLADTWNNRVRTWHAGKLHAFAGTAIKGNDPIGKEAHLAAFGGIFAVAFDPARERLVLTDLDNRRIYEVRPGARVERVTLLAGNGQKGTPKDGGKAVDEPLLDPRAAALDRGGRLYILERNGHCLRVVSAEGVIRTVAGTGKAGTAVGDAMKSQMSGPKHLCIDAQDCVIIADAENHRVLRYDPKTEKVSVIAGSGKKGAKLDTDPLQCELNRPHGVCVHPKTGELFVVDSYNDRILQMAK